MEENSVLQCTVDGLKTDKCVFLECLDQIWEKFLKHDETIHYNKKNKMKEAY